MNGYLIPGPYRANDFDQNVLLSGWKDPCKVSTCSDLLVVANDIFLNEGDGEHLIEPKVHIEGIHCAVISRQVVRFGLKCYPHWVNDPTEFFQLSRWVISAVRLSVD